MSIEQEDIEKFRAQLSLHDNYAGGPPNLAAAERLLREAGLWADANMQSLFQSRRDGGKNQLATRKLVMSLSSETQSGLKVAARLRVPFFVELSADYSRLATEAHEYTITVVVRF